MNKIVGRVLAACALTVSAGGAAAAQELPPAAPLAHPPHHVHRRHRTTHYHRPPPVAAVPSQPGPQADAGTTPAPVPNEDIGPPRTGQDPRPSLDPGSLQIHYPPLGDGYLPGSSPQDMANQQTPSVPGATVKVPLQQAAPATLPPPTDPGGNQ